ARAARGPGRAGADRGRRRHLRQDPREGRMSERELYSAATASEWFDFADRCCEHCKHDRAFRQGQSDTGWERIKRAMVFDMGDPSSPTEWHYGADGRPTCSAFTPVRARRRTPTEAGGTLPLFPA